jgi:hypothetical protein
MDLVDNCKQKLAELLVDEGAVINLLLLREVEMSWTPLTTSTIVLEELLCLEVIERVANTHILLGNGLLTKSTNARLLDLTE